MSGYRLDSGGSIDRNRPFRFTFDGEEVTGYAGDTVASALIASGRRIVARSFKYHRPRGIMSAGVEEPNALLELVNGDTVEANTRATTLEVCDGLTLRSQNRWPSLGLDVMAVNGWLPGVFAAGFYYKTFLWPPGGWMFYEKFIRRAAGMGRAGRTFDPARYDRATLFCEVLVVGAGPAGLTAALTAAEAGQDVVLVEQDMDLGGQALAEPDRADWLAGITAQVRAHPNIRVMTRTTAFGDYDSKVIGLAERVAYTADGGLPAPDAVQQRFWTANVDRVILAAGAIERPMVLAGNDAPGVMLASAAAAYIQRFAVSPGKRAVIFTNNDSAYDHIATYRAAGIEIAAVVDSRTSVSEAVRAKALGVALRTGHAVTKAIGKRGLRAVRIAPFGGGRSQGASTREDCDLLLVSGGWTPTIHLTSHRGKKPKFSKALQAFLPGDLDAGYTTCGAMIGHWSHEAAVQSGTEAVTTQPAPPEACSMRLDPLWEVPVPPRGGKSFVDQQHDVTASDIKLAHREGFVSVEHMKRYTTLGMAGDQGKTSNIAGLAMMSAALGQEMPQTGTTTFRAPFTPVPIGALAGHARWQGFKPHRRTPLRPAEEAAGAILTEVGHWHRAWFYPAYAGETLDAAYRREAAQVRKTVGIADVSTLGKISVKGPDAAEFLNRVYTNGWKKLPVGKVRYGLMLREDGMVMDDGTTARLGDHDYLMTTTSGNAGKVMVFLEYLLDTQWPDLRVHVTSVTDQWAGMSIAGPNSRDLLAAVVTGTQVDGESLPHMGITEGEIAGHPVRIYRLSFSGELAYEVFAPAGYGEAVQAAILEAGEGFGLVRYGLEALGTLRIEKGHVAGPELDGRTGIVDLGLGGMASSKKGYIGSVLQRRDAFTDPDRPRLVGLFPVDRDRPLKGGTLLYPAGAEAKGPGEGRVTSTTYSPALGRYIALGLLARGPDRHGEIVQAVNAVDGESCEVTVVSSHMFDPAGDRQYA